MPKLTHLPLFAILFIGAWGSAYNQVPGLVAETLAVSGTRQPRGIIKRLFCRRFGNCQNGYGGFQGGGYGGYPGYQQGYPGQIPAINIGISQSQSSASNGQGGYSSGSYPNNYQYNGNPGYGGYNQGYGGYNQGYGGYNQGYGGYNQGFGGYQRPGYFGNGNGGYNNQFNGNYNAGGNGGYGFQGPFGDDVSEDNKPEVDDNEYDQNENNYNQGSSTYDNNNEENIPSAVSYAYAGRKAN